MHFSILDPNSTTAVRASEVGLLENRGAKIIFSSDELVSIAHRSSYLWHQNDYRNRVHFAILNPITTIAIPANEVGRSGNRGAKTGFPVTNFFNFT